MRLSGMLGLEAWPSLGLEAKKPGLGLVGYGLVNIPGAYVMTICIIII